MQKQNIDWVAQRKINIKHLAYWTVAWTLTMALATFGPKFLWELESPLTIVGILINIGVGIGMILANKKHIKGLDELQQKIHLDAMAISLGVGVVFGLGYSLLDQTNLISYNAEISHLVVLMALTYLAGTIIGTVRYK